jgi:hypothetical protein
LKIYYFTFSLTAAAAAVAATKHFVGAMRRKASISFIKASAKKDPYKLYEYYKQ